MFLCHTVFAICNPAQQPLFAIGFYWHLLDSVFILVSTSPTSLSKRLGQTDGLPPSVDDDLDGARPGSQPPKILSKAEGSSSKKPTSSTAATLSEALILGVGGQAQPFGRAPECLGRETAPSATPPPIQPVSMSTLCLLGKP